jgi:hypothetical protein
MGSRSSLRVGLGVLALVATLSAPAAADQPAARTYAGATAGTVAPSVASSLAPQGLAPKGALATRPRGARRQHQQLAAAAPVSGPPQVAAPELGGAPASLLENFNGVSSRDSAVTNFGAEFEPPDQALCVGNGFVVEMVNSAYTVYDASGRTLAGPFNVNGPFNEGLTEFTSDPRCYFDAATNTWFAVVLAINPTETASSLDIAVNSSGDPRKHWTTYKVNTSDVGGQSGPRHPGCPCFGDQPTLGIDGENLYVTTAEFSLRTERFNGAQFYAFAKRDLVSLSPAVHFVHFDKLAIGGAPAGTVQPAITNTAAPAEFFLGSIDPSETVDRRIGVWAMTDRAAVAKGGIPKLSSVVVSSEPFGVPPKGEQKGVPSLIDAGDDRMQQAQFAGGSVWGELDTSLMIAGDRTPRAGASWFQFKPTIAEGVLTGAQITRQGYVAVLGNYVLYPALEVSPSGTAAMVMTVTGAKRFPSAAYATLSPGASSFGPVTVAAPGAASYDPEATRWGDYSWAVQDPAGSSVWLATEYVPPRSSQTADGARNWGTRVLEVPAG